MSALGGRLAIGALLLAALLFDAPAQALTMFIVTNTDDSGPGSLRQAIFDANAAAGADTISFGAGVTGTITLTSGQLTVSDDLAIDGPGEANLTISGNNASRVMEVGAGVTLDLEGVTVANGRFISAPTVAGAGILNFGTLTVSNAAFLGNDAGGGCCFGLPGGAIANSAGSVTVSNSIFSGNSAGGGGGAIYSEGGTGTLAVSDSTFSANSTNDRGGAIANSGGTVTVTNSTFSGNSSVYFGGAIANAGGGGTVTVTNSTFAGNSTSYGGGGGIGNFQGTLTVTNSTFSGNSSTFAGFSAGGGILNDGESDTVTVVTNSTFSGNSAGNGGGVSNTNGLLTLRNNIVANSPSGGNCSGTVIDGLGNLQFPGTDCGGTISSADPLLDPAGLQDNGGPTETIALQPGSPAIDAAVAVNCPATDQRGVSRPQGAGCDIGAFEREVAIGVPTCDGMAATIYVNASGSIVGGPQNGKIYAGKLKGTPGADVIVGTDGNDQIGGGDGDDRECGRDGSDKLRGGNGADKLLGEAGSDRLEGGDQDDTLTGGTGADFFKGGAGTDTATDFTPAEGDTKDKSVEIS